MDLDLSPEEEQLVAALATLLARESSPQRVREAEASGFDPKLWHQLQEMGIPSMAVGGDGEGATLFQLVLVAQQAGRSLASAPVIETMAAARLLARAGEQGAAFLERLTSGTDIVTVAWRPATEGLARAVSAGAQATIVLAHDGDQLVAVESPPPEPVANIGSLPFAHRSLIDGRRTVLADGTTAATLMAAARADGKALCSAQMVGLAAAALDIGVAYVKSREVFGAPIGTFQTIAHRLADDATAVDGARLLAYEAAWAIDEGRDNAAALASMAWAFATETALDMTRDSLHYHGGYGFTVEYDIQLYFRRAKALTLAWGDPRHEYQRVADALFAGADQ